MFYNVTVSKHTNLTTVDTLVLVAYATVCGPRDPLGPIKCCDLLGLSEYDSCMFVWNTSCGYSFYIRANVSINSIIMMSALLKLDSVCVINRN